MPDPILRVPMNAETSGYAIIDPTKLTQADMPLFVFADDRNSMVGWFIKWHTKGEYNHTMMMIEPGQFVSQDFGGFHRVPLENYMKANMLLKFFSYNGLREEQKQFIYKKIEKQLKENPYKKGYDWLGVFGQSIGIPWVNNPWKKYCSERVGEIARDVSIPVGLHDSPSVVNTIFHKHMPPLQIKGYWIKN